MGEGSYPLSLLQVSTVLTKILRYSFGQVATCENNVTSEMGGGGRAGDDAFFFPHRNKAAEIFLLFLLQTFIYTMKNSVSMLPPWGKAVPQW